LGENGVGPESIGNNIVNIEIDTTSQNFIGYGSCLDNIGNRYDRTWFDEFQGLPEDESRDACYNKCLSLDTIGFMFLNMGSTFEPGRCICIFEDGRDSLTVELGENGNYNDFDGTGAINSTDNVLSKLECYSMSTTAPSSSPSSSPTTAPTDSPSIAPSSSPTTIDNAHSAFCIQFNVNKRCRKAKYHGHKVCKYKRRHKQCIAK